jgi:DNA modification methylase
MLTVLQGDCVETLKTVEDNTVQCCVTSPPYWGLRDYGVKGQLGLETTVESYLNNMVAVFKEVRRVLTKTGTLWLNIGDSYAGSGKGRNADGSHQSGGKQGTNKGSIQGVLQKTKCNGVRRKNLIGIPWRLAFALQKDGWNLRQDVIWHKPNAMPESVKDRCTTAHEYFFMLTKSDKYHFDSLAIQEQGVSTGVRNKRSVWTVNTKAYRNAHFATFPAELIQPCILASSAKNDIVLDPFGGSGTTGQVALQLGRKAILCELNPKYIPLIEERTENVGLGL